MVLSSYCKQCNATLGHIHIPYRILLHKKEKDIEKDPTLHKKILNEFGLECMCCINTVMSGTVDRNLEEYIKLMSNEKANNPN